MGHVWAFTTLIGRRHVSSLSPQFDRKLAKSSLGGEVFAFREMVGRCPFFANFTCPSWTCHRVWWVSRVAKVFVPTNATGRPSRGSTWPVTFRGFGKHWGIRSWATFIGFRELRTQRAVSPGLKAGYFHFFVRRSQKRYAGAWSARCEERHLLGMAGPEIFLFAAAIN